MTIASESGRNHAIAVAFVVVLACLPLVAILAHRGAGILILLLGVLAACRVDIWKTGVRHFLLQPKLSDPLTFGALAYFAFCFWTIVSGFWSPSGMKVSLGFGLLLPVLAAGAVVWSFSHFSERSLRFVAKAYWIAVIAAAFLLILESHTGAVFRQMMPPEDTSPLRFKDMTAISRGITLIIPMLLPAFVLANMDGRKSSGTFVWIAFLSVALLLVASALKLGVVSNAIALILGAIAAAFAYFSPRIFLKIILVSSVAILLTSPFMAAWLPVETIVEKMGAALPASWAQRLFVWRETAQLALSCLPFGCGADAARAVEAAGESVTIQSSKVPLAMMPTHPHNMFLQIWMELGSAGGFLFALVIMMVGTALLRIEWSKQVTASIAGASVAVLVFATVEMSIWQLWRVGALSLAVIGIALSYYVNHFSVYKSPKTG